MSLTQFFQLCQAFIHTSPQLRPPGELILCTCLKEFGLVVENFGLESLLTSGERISSDPEVEGVYLLIQSVSKVVKRIPAQAIAGDMGTHPFDQNVLSYPCDELRYKRNEEDRQK